MPAMGEAGSMANANAANVKDLREYWNAILHHKWILITIFAASVLAAAVFSFLTTPIYEATTTILVQNQQSMGQLALFEGMGAAAKNTNQNYVEVLRSRTLAQRAMAKQGYHYEVKSPQFVAYKNSISVQLVQGSDAISIKVLHTDPQEASDRANAVVDAFMDMNQEANTEEARSARLFIEEQLKVVESDLRKAEEALRQYKEQQNVVAPSAEAEAILDQLSELEKSRAETSIASSQTQRQLTELRKKLAAVAPTTIATKTISTNPLIEQYKARLFELESQLAVTRIKYGEDYPQIATLNVEIDMVRQKLSEEVEKVVSAETHTANPSYQALTEQIVALEVESVALQARSDAVQKQISNVEKSLSTLPAKELDLTRLVRNQSVLEQIFLLLKNKSEEYRISEAIKAAGVTIIDRAIPPATYIKPNKKLNIAVAAFLGLFVGVAIIIFMEVIDNTFKSAEDVERTLGLPVIGSIPSFDLTNKMVKRTNRKMHGHRK